MRILGLLLAVTVVAGNFIYGISTRKGLCLSDSDRKCFRVLVYISY